MTTLPNLLAALAIWTVAIAGVLAYHHATCRRQPPAPPLPRRPVDPDRHPAPIDDTYLHLEALYHQPAWKENRP